jgi:hypothetical protein
MRGSDRRPENLFSYVDLEKRVRPDHRPRAIRTLTDSALEALSRDFRGALFRAGSTVDLRPRCCCGRCFCRRYSIRSERQLMERLEFDLLFRWHRRSDVGSLRA